MLLAWPALRADDKPKDDKPKEEKKTEQSPKEQYQALVKEFNEQRSKMVQEINKAKDDERSKLINKYYGLGQEFADKVYKIAEGNPKDPVASDAMYWVLQNGGGSPAFTKAADKFAGMVPDMPLSQLVQRVRMFRGAPVGVLQAVYDRAVTEEKEKEAADLLVWAATSGPAVGPAEKAVDRLFEKYPKNPMIDRVCSMLAEASGERLKKLLEKDVDPSVKAAAALALGNSLAEQSDRVSGKPKDSDHFAAEAEKYFTMVVDQFGKDDAARKKTAEKMIRVLHTLRVGKEAPEIKGVDLDEKEFKLADYRGKVVLLDFWGNW